MWIRLFNLFSPQQDRSIILNSGASSWSFRFLNLFCTLFMLPFTKFVSLLVFLSHHCLPFEGWMQFYWWGTYTSVVLLILWTYYRDKRVMIMLISFIPELWFCIKAWIPYFLKRWLDQLEKLQTRESTALHMTETKNYCVSVGWSF